MIFSTCSEWEVMVVTQDKRNNKRASRSVRNSKSLWKTPTMVKWLNYLILASSFVMVARVKVALIKGSVPLARAKAW